MGPISGSKSPNIWMSDEAKQGTNLLSMMVVHHGFISADLGINERSKWRESFFFVDHGRTWTAVHGVGRTESEWFPSAERRSGLCGKEGKLQRSGQKRQEGRSQVSHQATFSSESGRQHLRNNSANFIKLLVAKAKSEKSPTLRSDLPDLLPSQRTRASVCHGVMRTCTFYANLFHGLQFCGCQIWKMFPPQHRNGPSL